MIDLIKNLFETKKTQETSHLPIKDKFTRIQIAICAIFLEIANCDEEFSNTERNHIMSILKKKFDLADESVNEIMQIADKKRKESSDLWHFTSVINKNYSINDKIKIIETLWKLIYADKTLDKHEDYLIHKLSRLLHLTHKQFIDAKVRVLHDKK